VLQRIFNLVFRALVCGLLFSDTFANGGLLYVSSLVGLLRAVDFSNGHLVNESVELAWSDLNVVERQDPE
jgi:hypothetical protein